MIESYASCILFKLRTGADDDDDVPMDVDVKDGLDVDLQKQITAAFVSTRLLEHLVMLNTRTEVILYEGYWAPYFAFSCLTLDCIR